MQIGTHSFDKLRELIVDNPRAESFKKIIIGFVIWNICAYIILGITQRLGMLWSYRFAILKTWTLFRCDAKIILQVI